MTHFHYTFRMFDLIIELFQARVLKLAALSKVFVNLLRTRNVVLSPSCLMNDL